MGYLKLARAIGGLASLFTLLSLIILQFLVDNLMITQEIILLLVTLISALLGINILGEKMPISIKFGNGDN